MFRVEALFVETGQRVATVESPPGSASDLAPVLDSLQQRVTTTIVLGLAGVPLNTLSRLPSFEAAMLLRQGSALFEARDFAGSIPHFLQAYRSDTTFLPPLMHALIACGNLGRWSCMDSLLTIVMPRQAEIPAASMHTVERYSGWVRGDLEQVLQAERLAVRSDSNYSTLFNLSGFALQTGRPREALDALGQADSDGRYTQAWPAYWDRLASANHWLGLYREALEAARAGKARYAEVLYLRRLEIQALIALDRLEETAALLDEVERMEPDDGSSPGDVFRQVAADLARYGHEEESRELAERAVEWYRARDPESYRQEIAQALLVAGRAEEALEIIRPLVEETPDSLGRRGIYGMALVKTGDTAGAEAEAAWFEQLDSPYLFGKDTYWHAVILAHLGQLDEAVLLLRQAYREGRDRWEIRDDPNLKLLWGH